MQRQYELMVVLRPDFGPEEKQARDLVEKLIGDRKIKELTIMGKKRLAYPIKKQTEGVYVVATFTGKAMDIGALEKQIKLGMDVLRFLLIVKEPASAKATAGK
ncbi:MAG: 30S ribosomal protein S6 [Candidatus Gottesmanbacteria bacterium]|nr:30S ribosomal protein S6 [Candidatus Gottesmanbacteria bacterium]